MVPSHLDRYRSILRDRGGAAARAPETLLAASPPYELFYIPFEHVSPAARLVLVGITPGPTQLELAYTEAQRLIREGASDEEISAGAKRKAGFGGPLRANLLRMLRRFRFAELLGIRDEEELWAGSADVLHATSVVPHAAFKAGKMFAGSFGEVLGAGILKQSFERDFVSSLSDLHPEARFVALGRTPNEALSWCVREGHLRPHQVLGALAHPSGSAGSQIDVYLGDKTLSDLSPNDPVRHRFEWLQHASAELKAAIEDVLTGTRRVEHGGAPNSPETTAIARPPDKPELLRDGLAGRRRTGCATGSGIHYTVTRGANAGTTLRPHVENGCYIVSRSRFRQDYTFVPAHEPLEPYLRKGYSPRMSQGPGMPASLIAPASIQGWERS
jgi:hypothetical protein